MSTYDQTLLGEAPKATRAQLQEGYNVDLLSEQSVQRTLSVRSPPPPQSPPPPPSVTVPLMPAIVVNGSGEKFGSPAPPKPRTSFWRTRNGIITVIVLALVVTGAVVGGAVGGSANKGHKTTGSNIGSPTPSSSRPLISPLSATNNAGTSGSSPSSTGVQGIGGTNPTSKASATSTPTFFTL